MKLKIKKFNADSLILTLVQRELYTYFSTPLAYIILALFLIIVSIIFFGVFQFLQFGTADLTQLFSAIGFAFIIIIPALTMGSISREKSSGTIEIILTEPITEIEFIVGKFLSYAFLVLLMLASTLPLALVIGANAQLDIGQVIMQYIGAFLLGISFVSIGIAVSSLFKNEITSLLSSLLISVLFIVGGTSVLNFFPLSLQSLVEKFSLLAHYQSISRGVLDLRDLLYFLGFIFAFLGIAFFSILKDKFPSKDTYLNNARISLILIIVVALTIGFIGQSIPGRLDLTSNKKYTLSSGTVNVLNKLTDVFNVTFYASSNLPQDFQPYIREVQDTLRDYSAISNGKFRFVSKDPQNDQDAASQAQKDGLKQNIFAINSNDSSQQVVGYFGLTFNFLDKNDSMDLTNANLQQLEFQITKKIKKVANIDRAQIAVVTNNVKQTSQGITLLSNDLNELYNVTNIDLTNAKAEIPKDTKALIIPGPNQKFDDKALKAIKDYFNNGGSVFLMAEAEDYNPATQQPEKVTAGLADFFSNYGVTVNSDFVYDLTNNNQIQGGNGLVPIVVNYPFWVISKPTDEAKSIYTRIDTLTMIWASSITVDKSKAGNAKITETFKTSSDSNIEKDGAIDIQANSLQKKGDDAARTIAVTIETPNGARAVVTSDSDFINDNYLNPLQGRSGSQDTLDLAFVTSSIDWLTKDDSLASVQVKNRISPRFQATGAQSASLVAIGIVLPSVVIFGIGAFKFYRRRKQSNKTY